MTYESEARDENDELGGHCVGLRCDVSPSVTRGVVCRELAGGGFIYGCGCGARSGGCAGADKRLREGCGKFSLAPSALP